MDKVPEWNGTPGMLRLTVDGEPHTLMVTPANMQVGQMQVGQMCAFRMAHEGTSHRQATDCVPLPLNTTAGEAADMIKRMNLNPATSDLIDRMNRNAATYERDFQLYVPALTRDGHSLLMSELEHFWSMTDRSYSLGNRAIELLNTLRLDGVQFNMTHYVWENGSDHNLRDGLLVLLTSVINVQ